MMPILVHYTLTLDLTGYPDVEDTVNQFIRQADLSDIEKSVKTTGNECVISFTLQVAETLTELREAIKYIPTGLFSNALKVAVKAQKEESGDIYLELSVRLPLYGMDEKGVYN